MSDLPPDEKIVRAVVAPLCVCDEPMRPESSGPNWWRFVCAACGAAVHVVDGTEASPAPAETTAERPGTDGKIAVMQQRWRRGESLFHARDDRTRTREPHAQAGKRAGPRSLPPGVSWHVRRRKYQAVIRVGGRKKHLGLFVTAAEAEAAVAAARDAT